MNQIKKERGNQGKNTPIGGNNQKRRNRAARLFLRGLLLIVLCTAAAGFYVYDKLKPPAANGNAEKTINIPSGSSVWEIGQILEKEGLIKDADIFSLYVKIKNVGNRLQAGNYRFHVGQPVSQLVKSMADGDVVADTVKFTIPEGWNVEQIAASLAGKGIVDKTAFLREVNQGNFSEFAFVSSIKPKEGRKYRLEGYLFPETYEVKKGASAHEIIAKMLSQFQKEIKPEWIAELAKRKISLDDAIILASIVEREVTVDKERPIVAGVLYNRLQNDWMLQADATIQYVLGTQRDRITYNDLKIESPYNTYLHRGLPPGPIANPGRASIAAVVEPTKHDYFFYVTKKDGSSEHYFSKTLEEHLAQDAKSRKN